MMQPWENGKNPNFRPNLPPSPPKKILSGALTLVVLRQWSKLSSYPISRKTNDHTWKNDKKLNFRPDFGIFALNLSPLLLLLLLLLSFAGFISISS